MTAPLPFCEACTGLCQYLHLGYENDSQFSQYHQTTIKILQSFLVILLCEPENFLHIALVPWSSHILNFYRKVSHEEHLGNQTLKVQLLL